jgi:hypothetical protein
VRDFNLKHIFVRLLVIPAHQVGGASADKPRIPNLWAKITLQTLFRLNKQLLRKPTRYRQNCFPLPTHFPVLLLRRFRAITVDLKFDGDSRIISLRSLRASGRRPRTWALPGLCHPPTQMTSINIAIPRIADLS